MTVSRGFYLLFALVFSFIFVVLSFRLIRPESERRNPIRRSLKGEKVNGGSLN